MILIVLLILFNCPNVLAHPKTLLMLEPIATNFYWYFQVIKYIFFLGLIWFSLFFFQIV